MEEKEEEEEVEEEINEGDGGIRFSSLNTTKSKSLSDSAKILAAFSGKFLRRKDSAWDSKTKLRSYWRSKNKIRIKIKIKVKVKVKEE